jgi:hypothetical protein
MLVLGQIAPAITLGPSSGSTATTQKCASDRILLTHPTTGATRCTTSCPSGYRYTVDARTNTKYCKPVDLGCSATQIVAIDDRTWARRCVARPIGKIAAAMTAAAITPTPTQDVVKVPTGATAPAPKVATPGTVMSVPTMPAVPGVVTTTPTTRKPLSTGAKIALGVGAIGLVAGGAALIMTRR